MSKIIALTPSLFRCSQSVYSIEASLESSCITRETRDSLFDQLQATSKLLGSLSKSNLTDELEERIVYLYGRISHLSVDLELAELKAETKALEESLVAGNIQEISSKADHLKNHIIRLCYECALSQSEKEVIRQANEVLQKSNNFLQGTKPSKKHSMHSQEDVDLDVIAPFFDIAYLIYKERFRDAKKLYNQLPSHEKKIFLTHFKNLSSDEIDFSQNPFLSIQALLASAYAVCQMECPPSELAREEIQLMFVELDEILKAE